MFVLVLNCQSCLAFLYFPSSYSIHSCTWSVQQVGACFIFDSGNLGNAVLPFVNNLWFFVPHYFCCMTGNQNKSTQGPFITFHGMIRMQKKRGYWDGFKPTITTGKVQLEDTLKRKTSFASTMTSQCTSRFLVFVRNCIYTFFVNAFSCVQLK